MSSDTINAAHRTDDVLQQAIMRDTPVLISYRTAQGWTSYPARFTQVDADHDTIHLRLAHRNDENINPEFSSGDHIGVTFRRAHKKCMFSSMILSMASANGTFVIRRPARFQELQRRVFERTAPPSNRKATVKLWRVQDDVDGDVSDDCIVHGTLDDISVGGTRICVDQPNDLILDATYCCSISIGQFEDDLVVEAVLRHHEVPRGDKVSLGFRFIGLEATETGRQNMIRIARLVSRYQRCNSNAARVRMHRRRKTR